MFRKVALLSVSALGAALGWWIAGYAWGDGSSKVGLLGAAVTGVVGGWICLRRSGSF